VLDLYGGAGEPTRPIAARGYEYVNVDLTDLLEQRTRLDRTPRELMALLSSSLLAAHIDSAPDASIRGDDGSPGGSVRASAFSPQLRQFDPSVVATMPPGVLHTGEQ
jgi:hypothetical protein